MIRRAFLLSVVALALAACAHHGAEAVASADASPDDEFSDASVFDPLDSEDASLGTRVTMLFSSARCAGGPETDCHGRAAGNLRLDLGPGGDVIDVASSERPELRRVAPRDVLGSYLYLKVRGDGGIDGDVMPKDRGFDPRIERLVGAWIDAGAPVR